MSNPQGSTVQPPTDGSALIIDPTAYDSSMHAHGEVIQGQGPQGQQWSRHTVVYDNGPCSCCISMNGGSYGPDVTPAEKRE
ncbi:hypothetical protein CFO_g715 [Ceratocystis platani]|uniref:Uncharacterized protein n=2 Tax=Ceratocystis TaxID=5157 RepID=A0A0F8B4T2_CERFI|nr:hypothetical protein CFO_g715 [Ceratocystis platani]